MLGCVFARVVAHDSVDSLLAPLDEIQIQIDDAQLLPTSRANSAYLDAILMDYVLVVFLLGILRVQRMHACELLQLLYAP